MTRVAKRGLSAGAGRKGEKPAKKKPPCQEPPVVAIVYHFHLRVKYLFHLRVKYHFHLRVKHQVRFLGLIRMDLSQPCPYTVLSATSRTCMFHLNFLLPPKHHRLGLVHLPLLGRFVLHSDCTSLLVTLLHATDARSALLVLAPHTTSLCNMRKTDHSSTQGQVLQCSSEAMLIIMYTCHALECVGHLLIHIRWLYRTSSNFRVATSSCSLTILA